LLELQQRIIDADALGEAAVTAVAAKWLGVPTSSDCPTPGQARNRTRDQWEEWARGFGYVFEGRTTHCYLYKHPIVPHLAFGIATSPGDFRTPMAMAREVRCGVRNVEWLVRYYTLLLACTGIRADAPCGDDEDAARRLVGLHVTNVLAKSAEISDFVNLMLPVEANGVDSIRGYSLSDGAAALLTKYVRTSLDRKRNDVDVALVNARFRTFKNEFDLSPKQVMKAAMGADYAGQEEAVAKLLEVLKLSSPASTIPMPAGIMEEFTDLLDYLRDVARAEKEAKRAEREAERQAKAEKAKPVQRGLRELAQDGIDGRRQTIIDQLHSYEKLAQSLVDRMRVAQTQVPLFPLPEFADPAELDAARAEIVQLQTEREAVDAYTDDLEAKVAHLTTQLADAGDSKAIADQVEAARAFAGVTADTLKSVAQMNPFQMVSALQALQQQAEELKTTLAPKVMAAVA
jgi:hypothetical protein